MGDGIESGPSGPCHTHRLPPCPLPSTCVSLTHSGAPSECRARRSAPGPAGNSEPGRDRTAGLERCDLRTGWKAMWSGLCVWGGQPSPGRALYGVERSQAEEGRSGKGVLPRRGRMYFLCGLAWSWRGTAMVTGSPQGTTALGRPAGPATVSCSLWGPRASGFHGGDFPPACAGVFGDRREGLPPPPGASSAQVKAGGLVFPERRKNGS